MARPRSEEARNAAIDATVALLLSSGLDSVTFDEVACRSGVAKTTLYRHFGSKQGLILAATATCAVEVPTPDTGDLAEDLRAIMRRSMAIRAEGPTDILPVLLAVADRDPEIQEVVRTILDERHRPIRTVLQLAQLRGEIARSLDLDLAIHLLVGPIVMATVVGGAEVTEAYGGAVVDHVVAGLRAMNRQGLEASEASSSS